MRSMDRLLLCCVIGLLPGCYSYASVPVESIGPGAAVRARITAVEADRLRQDLGRGDRVLVGTVLDADDGEILLAVPSARSSGARAASGLRQRIAVPRGEIIELEARRLNGWRTAAVVAASALIGGLVVSSQFGDDDDAAGRPDEPNVEALRVPLLRLRWP